MYCDIKYKYNIANTESIRNEIDASARDACMHSSFLFFFTSSLSPLLQCCLVFIPSDNSVATAVTIHLVHFWFWYAQINKCERTQCGAQCERAKWKSSSVYACALCIIYLLELCVYLHKRTLHRIAVRCALRVVDAIDIRMAADQVHCCSGTRTHNIITYYFTHIVLNVCVFMAIVRRSRDSRNISSSCA